MKKKQITKADYRLFKEFFGKKDLMCAIDGCSGIAGEYQDYCRKHRAELKIVPNEAFSKNYVYFVMAVGTDMIKIGTASDVDKRLNNLQVGCPSSLLLLVSIPGDSILEKILHKLLDEHRKRGEWFKMSDEVLDVVDVALNQGRRGVNLWIEKKKAELTNTTK